MTITFNTVHRKGVNNTYGGELTLFDFEGHHTMVSMTGKIVSDLQFDKQCKRNIKLRKMTEERKNEKSN